jgi:hypothetical protein
MVGARGGEMEKNTSKQQQLANLDSRLGFRVQGVGFRVKSLGVTTACCSAAAAATCTLGFASASALQKGRRPTGHSDLTKIWV